MQISDVHRIGRSRRYQVLVEGQVVLEADEEVIAQFGLAPGRALGEERIAEVQQADRALLAGRAALRLLKFRARSRQELARILRAKKFDAQAIDLTLDRLEQARLINDSELAGNLARQLRERKMGSRLVRQKMLQAGLDRELTDSTLAALGQEGELERAQELAEKYLRRSSTEPPNRLRPRLYQYLIRRGFDSDLCCQVVERAVPDSE
jgi:regulatory protein